MSYITVCSYIMCITYHAFNCIALYELCILPIYIGRLCEKLVYCGCKSCIVFTVQFAVCVLYLHYCQPSVPCVLSLYCISTTANVVWHVSYSCIVCMCICSTASAVCYECECCVVFALLPAQCAVRVSPVMCLHYCQCSVLCVCVLCLHYCQCSVLYV